MSTKKSNKKKEISIMIPYEKQLIYRNEIGFSVVRTNIQFNRFY